jgi:hypothetical protein
MVDYKDIFELVKYFHDIASPPPPFLRNEPDGYAWVDVRNSLPEELEWVNCGRDFSPGKLFPLILSGGLYRGQTEIYSPCYPKIYRNFPLVKRPRELSTKYRTKFLASQVKTLWFISLLQEHPAVHHARRLKIQINPIAIAQHYGMFTHYLDLTQSIEVAAFFACCEYKDKAWQPRSTGKGVIYHFGPMSNAELIGLVTFPRPGEQKAWSVPLCFGADFDKIPHVEKFSFNHTLEGSKYFLEMFDSGKVIFLEDLAANLADSIINSKIVPKDFVIQALLRFGCLPNKIEKTLEIFKNRLDRYCNLEVKNNVAIHFTKSQIKKIKLYLSKHKDNFKGKVIPVRDSIKPEHASGFCDK